MLTGRIVEVPHSFAPVRVARPRRQRAEFPFVGFIDFQGIPIHVENLRGSIRSGATWSVKMQHHYGEIDGTQGVDGDPLDAYVGPNHDASLVVVIHQHDPQTGRYDEDKVMLGFDSVEAAVGAYKAQYDNPRFYGGHTCLPIGRFWRWVADRGNLGKRIRKGRAHLGEGATDALLKAQGWKRCGRRAFRLLKAKQHKYVKRVPYTDKRGRKKYRYYYKETLHRLPRLGGDDTLTVGASFQLADDDGTPGHFHIVKIDSDGVHVRHDETGRLAVMTRAELRDRLDAAHGADHAMALDTKRRKREARIKANYDAAKEAKSGRHMARWIKEALKTGMDPEKLEPRPLKTSEPVKAPLHPGDMYGPEPEGEGPQPKPAPVVEPAVVTVPASEPVPVVEPELPRVKNGQVLTRIESRGRALSDAHHRALYGRKRHWWLRGPRDFVDLGQLPNNKPVDVQRYLPPGLYTLGCGDRDDGIRVQFEVPHPDTLVPARTEPGAGEPELTAAVLASPRPFEWAPGAPPDFLGLDAGAIGLEFYKEGKWDRARMDMNIPFLKRTGFYTALKGRGDYWALGMLLSNQGKRKTELSDNQKTHIDRIASDLFTWWGGLTDRDREVFARFYCDPTRQAGTAASQFEAIHHDDAFEPSAAMAEKLAARKMALHGYQKKAANFAIKHASGGRAVWAKEMGLGKTLAALATFDAMKAQGRVDRCIVVAPVSAHGSWAKEGTTTTNARAAIAGGGLSAKRREALYAAFQRGEYDILVVSPDGMTRDGEKLKEAMGDPRRCLRVADEVHYYKNPKSKRTKMFRAVMGGDRPGPVIGMTGTVTPNKPEDFFHTVDAISPGTLGKSVWGFAERYCAIHKDRFGVKIVGFRPEKLEDLYRDNARTLFVRRRSDPDVKLDLPPRLDLSPRLIPDSAQETLVEALGEMMELHKRSTGDVWGARSVYRFENDVWPAMTRSQQAAVSARSKGRDMGDLMQAYREIEQEKAQAKIDAIRSGPNKLRAALAAPDVIPKNKLGVILRARQISVDPAVISAQMAAALPEGYRSPKMEACADAVVSHLANNPDKGAVVFSSFTSSLGRFKSDLEAQGIESGQIAVIDGSTPSAMRQKIVEDLNAGRVKVVIAQTTSMMTGANMQERASLVVHLDTPYRPDELSQSTARVYRQGQKNPVTVFRPTGSGIEEAIEASLAWKIDEAAKSQGAMMDADREILASIQRDGAVAELTNERLAALLGIDPRLLEGDKED